jgi:hypothetical protein
MNLGSLIERAVKQIEDDRIKEAAQDEADSATDDDEAFERSLFESDSPAILSDSDFADFSDFEEEEERRDQEFFDSLEEDD